MSNKKIREIRNLSKDELLSQIRESQNKLFEAKMQLKTGQLEDTGMLWRLRKDLARMNTVLTELSKAQKA